MPDMHDTARAAQPYQRYMNYGMFQSPERVGLWGMRMDSWYFVPDEWLGILDLGVGPLTGKEAARYLWQQIHLFMEVFGALVRVQIPVDVNYQNRESIPAGYSRYVSWSAEEAFLSTVQTGFRAPNDIIQGAYVHWDGRVFMRDDRGIVVERWLPSMGIVHLAADLHGIPVAAPMQSLRVEWSAYLSSDYVSLFRRDNAALLATARAHWKQLRAHDPTITWDRDELTPTEGIVTLVDAPEDTPPDNQDLYERNAPRLRSAIARWEQAVGHPFEWRVDLDA